MRILCFCFLTFCLLLEESYFICIHCFLASASRACYFRTGTLGKTLKFYVNWEVVLVFACLRNESKSGFSFLPFLFFFFRSAFSRVCWGIIFRRKRLGKH